jgi:hypothetical protein
VVDSEISMERLFIECNEHLREVDRKRDQLISFYLVLVGGFFTMFASDRVPQQAVIWSAVIVSALGMVLVAGVSEMRLWHSKYVETARLLAALSCVAKARYGETEGAMRRLAHAKLEIWAPAMSRSWFVRRYLGHPGTELLTHNAAILAASIPVSVVLLGCWWTPVLSIAWVFALLAIGNNWAAKRLFEENAGCPWAKWLLNGFEVPKELNLTYTTDFKPSSGAAVGG